MTTITWLHIADLHFRLGQTYDASIVLRELLKDVAARSEQADLRPDFIVVTGDVAFSGQLAEYDLACHFFDDLLRTTGLDKEYLFVVPGNHDVNRSLISRGAQLLAGSLRDRDSVNAVLDTPGDRQLLLARLQGYGNFVNDYLDGYARFDGENYFHVRTLALAGLQIAILGLNSAWLAQGGDEDRGKLVLGERQVRETLDQASTADLKIALLHHPFDWLQDFDRQDCEALLSAHCDFVLHGHVHSASTARITSPDSATQIFACGAGFEMREKMNRYNYVRLDLDAGQGTVFWRIWSDRGGGFWTQDAMTYRNAPDGRYVFPLATRFISSGHSDATANASSTSPTRPAGNQPTPLPRLHIDPNDPPIAAIRNLLEAAFPGATLKQFCQDRSQFRGAVTRFGMSAGPANLADKVIEYCGQFLLWDDLLAEVAQVNPGQYARFEAGLSGSNPPLVQRSNPAPSFDR